MIPAKSEIPRSGSVWSHYTTFTGRRSSANLEGLCVSARFQSCRKAATKKLWALALGDVVSASAVRTQRTAKMGSNRCVMSEFHSLFRLELGPHHLRPGRAKHRLRDATGLREFPPFKALEICTTSPPAGFCLLYEPDTGPGTDTWHETLEDAFNQAELEFGVARDEWQKSDRSCS